MDFWSRLIAHTPLSSGSSRKDFAKDPARRLHRFEKEYTQLLTTWRNSSNLAHDVEAAEQIEIRLQELASILKDESQRPLPHPCIAFAAAKQVYIPVAKIATSSFNEWIIQEAVLFFATLIESEEEAFVENDVFSASLTNLLVRITGANSIRLSADIEARVVELAFNITTKIRLDPDILPAWFKSQQITTTHGGRDGDDHSKFTGRTQKQDFPLFYLLIDYIHHDGKVGDFARTGLLYIIEAASNSVPLEQWIVESDLSTLMATGLGALYSQLSRKLVIDHPANQLPPILALSDYQHPKSNYEIISSCTFEFQSHLDTFLSHLLFWQDVLNHCRSVEVKSTLLEHFQVIFLQQLLYPSLLESSDIDGGSAVAVLTYLRRILESLDHPDMINLILHYLLALPVSSVPSDTHDVVSAARKRKSMDLATMMASKGEEAADTSLFSLVDLILACLRSHSHQTIYVTLQLVSVILKRHHRYAVNTLLYTEGVLGSSSHRRTWGAHQQEVEYLMSLAGTIGGQDNFDEIYENVQKDTLVRLENHPCSIKLVTPKTSTNNHKLPAIPDSLPGAPRDVRSHTLSPDDRLLNIIVDRLHTFFLNPVETNLVLTEAIFDLAVCGFMYLEGWFLRNPQSYVFEDDSDGSPLPEPPLSPDSPEYIEYKQVQSMQECRRRPKWMQSSLPRLLAMLQTLCDEVVAYRETVPRFDELLQQRREAFQIADSANPMAAPVPVRPRNPASHSPARTTTPAMDRTVAEEGRNASRERPSGLEALAQRFFSELGTPSRSGSPRGRKEMNRSSSDRSTPAPYETPSRLPTLGARSFSPGSITSVPGSWDNTKGDDAVANQAKAFQAIDQSILARRVGIPAIKVAEGTRVEPIPLSFDKQQQPQSPTEALADGEDEIKATDRPSSGDDGQSESVAMSEDGKPEFSTPPEEKTVSVSHVLTNVIILQSFLLELASLVQVRAGLFGEVRHA
ncbi:Retinoic acid induced 16-like protein-domain-containing protein [Podospora didyma]|uniref:Retinoic acid induced 16-like protein-domain-containing protein n=1 Tax=Podospora didyma TaxID=330526 RepID=A0AAE0K5M0_9PEZI|nr:Retinoic acid induced 16-like protein-domain-containing protein [Podospora didyma]